MSTRNPTHNRLYFGDNLNVLRNQVEDETVDLIYLDPPFNSKASYNVLFAEQNGTQSRAQITAFEDTWHWGMESEGAYYELVTQGPGKLPALIQALRAFLGQNDMMAYLVMMAIRLVELHRVLKPTGSIYLHCDPTASHYLKLVMDAVFGPRSFRNEIVWHYNRWTAASRNFQRMHDTIFWYSRGPDWTYNMQYKEYAEGSKRAHDQRGYIQRGSFISKPNPRGVAADDVWNYNFPARSTERLGYPTQKPECLLERIIRASSNPGDLVLDPFCGCGTTIAVAERLQRRWIGIDITYLAVKLMKRRLHDTFGDELSPYSVLGAPKDLPGARALAEHDRYQFEWWALDLVGAHAAQDKRKGADTGVDGHIFFFDDRSGQAKKVVVQVKSGHVSASQIRDLKGVLERERAAIAAFITLKPPTRPMLKEAAGAGYYNAKAIRRKYPRVQIRTIEDLLAGKKLDYYQNADVTFTKAERKTKRPGSTQNHCL